MTTHQRITLMADWWPAACTAQGWDKNDRAKRIEVLSQAVGRFLASASDLDHLKDIDAVKAHLAALARPADLATQIAQVNMPKTRLKHAIGNLAPPAYTAAIMRARFKTADLDDLSEEQLTQLRNTLAARNKKPIRSLRTEPQLATVADDNEPF